MRHGSNNPDQAWRERSLATDLGRGRLRVGDIPPPVTIHHFKHLTTQSQESRPAGYGCDGCVKLLSDGTGRQTKSRRWSVSSSAHRLEIEGYLSLNITPGALCHPEHGIHKTIEYANEIGLPLNRLTFEITEREVIDDCKPIRKQIHRDRNDGLRIALDDFGTGFNGLNTLLELRPDSCEGGRD
jgi:hypothetical protein